MNITVEGKTLPEESVNGLRLWLDGPSPTTFLRMKKDLVAMADRIKYKKNCEGHHESAG